MGKTKGKGSGTRRSPWMLELKKGLRGRLAMYVPPVLETLGLAQVEPRNNRMRAR